MNHPSENIAGGWAPDGTQLIFISNRTGINAVWSLPLKNGKAAGIPLLIKTDISHAITPIKLTENGSFYYGINSGGRDVYTASFNPDDPEPFGPAVRISQRYQGANRKAAWSNNGKAIAYVAGRQLRENVLSNAVVIHDLKTGREREIIMDVRAIGDYVSWSPDDNFIVFAASIINDHMHKLYLLMNPVTGEIKDETDSSTCFLSARFSFFGFGGHGDLGYLFVYVS